MKCDEYEIPKKFGKSMIEKMRSICDLRTRFMLGCRLCEFRETCEKLEKKRIDRFS